MKSKHLLLALFGLLIGSCSRKDNGIALPSIDSSKLAYSLSLPFDFGNGTWGESKTTLETYEYSHGVPLALVDSIYYADVQQTIVQFWVTGAPDDTYIFNKYSKLIRGVHLTQLYVADTAYYTYKRQLLSEFNSLLVISQAKYGRGIVNLNNLTATFKTNRSTITLSEKNASYYLHYFLFTYLPVDIAETI